ncbi:YozQ family protein [Cytobacillus sp. Hz8]|uniref:YozQ family protein n=1 Tax=Cytobacillus sp. Hz8 TaxID=3347168 RepID=UPI0035DD0B5B
MKGKNQNNDYPVANRVYQSEDYQRKDEVSSGLATTHEQVSDTFTEGEIQSVIENVNGKEMGIPRKGSEE